MFCPEVRPHLDGQKGQELFLLVLSQTLTHSLCMVWEHLVLYWLPASTGFWHIKQNFRVEDCGGLVWKTWATGGWKWGLMGCGRWATGRWIGPTEAGKALAPDGGAIGPGGGFWFCASLSATCWVRSSIDMPAIVPRSLLICCRTRVNWSLVHCGKCEPSLSSSLSSFPAGAGLEGRGWGEELRADVDGVNVWGRRTAAWGWKLAPWLFGNTTKAPAEAAGTLTCVCGRICGAGVTGAWDEIWGRDIVCMGIWGAGAWAVMGT